MDKRDEAAARRLRLHGFSYADVGRHLGVSGTMVWVRLNRERQKANNRDSNDRYVARGRIALCDMNHVPVWPAR